MGFAHGQLIHPLAAQSILTLLQKRITMKKCFTSNLFILQFVFTLFFTLNAQKVSIGGGVNVNSKIKSEYISGFNSNSYFKEELDDFTNFILEARIQFKYGIAQIAGIRYQHNRGKFVLDNVPYSNRKTTFAFIEPFYCLSFQINKFVDINPGIFFGLGKVDDDLKYLDHTIFELRDNSWSPSFGFQIETPLKPISSIQLLAQFGYRWFDQDPFMTDNAYQIQRESPPHISSGNTDFIDDLYFRNNRNKYSSDDWFVNLQVLITLPIGK